MTDSAVQRNPLIPERLRSTTDANALAAGVWSATAHRNDSGELEIGGVAASALLEQFGSPLYVLDEADIRDRAAAAARDFAAAFAAIGSTCTLHYASKALLTVEVARWMRAAGLGLDVASQGELEVALAAGVDPATIGVHGNNKTPAALERAVAAGVGTIIVDSDQEIERVAEIAAAAGRVQPVLVRINSGIHAATHDFLATSHEDQKFGFTFDAARAAIARIRELPSIVLQGLHSHIGSSIYDAGGFGAAADRLMRFRAELLAGGPVPEVNLGGGFGIAYLATDEATPLDELARGIAAEVQRACAETGSDVPAITFEPGRSLVGTGGTTLYRIGTTKTVEVSQPDGTTAERCYVSVDGGMSDNIRPSLYGADYTSRLANRESDAPARLVRVVGSHCESGDIVIHDDLLPGDVAPGDLLAVPATGAYGFAMANFYNYFERPALVAVRDGAARTLVRRITIHDLLGYDEAAAGEEPR